MICQSQDEAEHTPSQPTVTLSVTSDNTTIPASPPPPTSFFLRGKRWLLLSPSSSVEIPTALTKEVIIHRFVPGHIEVLDAEDFDKTICVPRYPFLIWYSEENKYYRRLQYPLIPIPDYPETPSPVIVL